MQVQVKWNILFFRIANQQFLVIINFRWANSFSFSLFTTYFSAFNAHHFKILKNIWKLQSHVWLSSSYIFLNWFKSYVKWFSHVAFKFKHSNWIQLWIWHEAYSNENSNLYSNKIQTFIWQNFTDNLNKKHGGLLTKIWSPIYSFSWNNNKKKRYWKMNIF